SCHHHDHLCLQAVCAPEFLTVQDESLPVRRRFRMCFHLRRVGADRRFSESECGYLTAGNSWQKPALLLLGSKQNQRLWHTDRLVGRNECREVAAKASEHHSRSTVICL